MPVPYCYICEENEAEKRFSGEADLQAGDYCPVCYRPTCRRHMGRVIWRWKDSGQRGEALVCLECKSAYRHREWDTYHRNWIS